HGLQALLHHQAGRPRRRAADGQANHGALRRQGQPDQPRAGRHPHLPELQGRWGTQVMEHSVLIVEDDELLAGNIQTYLERKNFEALVCHSAEEALELLQDQVPDVLLTDNSLPGMSGHELIREVSARAPQIKPIMMTGYGNIEDAVQAMKAGAFHYLTKPVALAELKLLLEKALEAQRLEHKLDFYHSRAAQDSGLEALIGDSPAMLEVKSMVRQLLDAESRMADAELPAVLIEGETGTGKELIARALHFDGTRSKGP